MEPIKFADGYSFCPTCKSDLEELEEEAGVKYKSCVSSDCKFTYYDGPQLVVAVVVPMEQDIVLVKRGKAPCVGEWSLPGGYVHHRECPKKAGIREVGEETGLEITLASILDTTTPFPWNGNQATNFYEGQVVGGQLQAGSDALEACRFPRRELPDLCFGSHQMVLGEYLRTRFPEGRL